ncbi:MAG: aldehyde dehydrogenase family protein [Flavobacteriaceae bacterium]|jgi:aldehyde dehydrogenase (NAD+)|nr:aldehyde dehydrogenase family protein [Flavobacteriaceae bacterium]MDG1686343.1 aldehyde dehydrogenase family protein [Flavobacteriaceae bacterium]MDG2235269.1 aldehyde dehydrogenase family protein [Flavobacteriaceae bacterium]|tara:strand:+ start:6831 stop:8363 length:1533 start_codon:yes stop_codon:yes gene_type:complete
MEIKNLLEKLNIKNNQKGCNTGGIWIGEGEILSSFSPVNDLLLGTVQGASVQDYEHILDKAEHAFLSFRAVPAPKRGDLVRQLGNKLREKKSYLGQLVSWEMGKSLQEGLGEVQEMIDICDFAVGLSRQLYGLTMTSERPSHRLYEQYHPLGVVGIISAFNFPVAVWSWNVALAWVCGNVCIWKPSEKTPLCSIACQQIISEVLKENSMPEGISCIINGGAEVGKWIAEDHRIALVSATGSTRMGKDVGQRVASRLGKSLLELGGNNAIIISPHADLNTAIPASVFGAVGTCGQRCTSTRRLIVHESIFEEFINFLQKAYEQLRIGNPLDENNHVGPLIDLDAVEVYTEALSQVEAQGGAWLVSGSVLSEKDYGSNCYVKPAVAIIDHDAPIVHQETFAPILYVIKYKGEIEEAISIQNEVKQGLSSSIMSLNVRETEIFLSHWGSDCGIANVNIGTSGAEIGGAFGGEKETGGGRESGSDAWKTYMRRQTNTINFSKQVPLAQGITFDL